ncbi:MAG TPA: nitroreductase family protein [Acidimicrobiia bacterium]
MTVPDLSFDEVLTTTRAVRRRLDLERPVSRAVVEECLRLAFQAPNGSNQQTWGWVLVDDPDIRAEMARIYVAAMDDYIARPRRSASSVPRSDSPAAAQSAARMTASVLHLREHFHEVPVLLVPTVAGRLEGRSIFDQASRWGSIIPAVWSFMLALRSRGLGSAWTTLHLHREEEMAGLLGIPYGKCTQAGMFPVAYTIGTEFHPADRSRSEERIRWNHW